MKDTAIPLSGAGKPTGKTITSIQNYYGKKIRSNSDELYAMKKAVSANLWHLTTTTVNIVISQKIVGALINNLITKLIKVIMFPI